LTHWGVEKDMTWGRSEQEEWEGRRQQETGLCSVRAAVTGDLPLAENPRHSAKRGTRGKRNKLVSVRTNEFLFGKKPKKNGRPRRTPETKDSDEKRREGEGEVVKCVRNERTFGTGSGRENKRF